jgi:hypothetical protein
MTTTLRTNNNGQPRKTLASHLDRLDDILDGLDAALAGAVQEAVGLAVKEAVQAVLTEVLTNPDLQEQLRRASPNSAAEEQTSVPKSWAQRLWERMVQGVRQTVQMVGKVGTRIGLALLAAGGLLAGVVYTVRRQLAAGATAVYHVSKRLLGGAVTALMSLLPSLAISAI